MQPINSPDDWTEYEDEDCWWLGATWLGLKPRRRPPKKLRKR